ncbi:transducin-like enhancer protein 3 isoform X11 [Tachysurus ichikawai]
MYPQGRHPAPHQPGQPGFKFTVAESCDRIKDEFQFLQAQYHSLKVEYDKLANEKTEMQRHYVMYYEMSYGLNIEMHKQLPPQSPGRQLNNSSTPRSNLLDRGKIGGCQRANVHTSSHSSTLTPAQEHKADEEWLTARGGSDYSIHTIISSRLKDLYSPTGKSVSLHLRCSSQPPSFTSPVFCVFK